MRNIFFVFIVLTFAISLFDVSNAKSTHTIEIETRILDFDPQAGMKSTQTISVDFDSQTVTSKFITGTTDFFGIILESVRNNFTVNTLSINSTEARLKIVGETASGVGIIPNINYAFEVKIYQSGRSEIKGCHDGYPGYVVRVNGEDRYNFEHKPMSLINLFGECDIVLE